MPRNQSTSRLLLIFFISGMSGLIYQVVWVREFGQIFGNTVHSAAIVTGIFMAGLGVGSFGAGYLIDKKHMTSPTAGLRYYAFAELLIGVLGFLVSILLPRIQSLSPLISSYHQGANGWFEPSLADYVFRSLTALAVVGPISLLMGSSLAFLIRFILPFQTEEAAWKIGLLYGINTLGAALGCLAVDIFAVPAIGLMSTKMTAVLMNFIAGLMALKLLKSAETDVAKPQPAAAPTVSPATPPSSGSPVWLLGVGILISGFCAMGMEMVWFRYLGSVMCERRWVFSIVLATLLAGMWAGAGVSGWLSKKLTFANRLFILSQCLFASSVVLGFYWFIDTNHMPFSINAGASTSAALSLMEFLTLETAAVKTVLLPGFFMGAAFPLICEMAQREVAAVGRRAGHIYLWNAVGALLGSVVTGFYFLSHLGMKSTTSVLIAGSLLATLPVLLYTKEIPRRRPAWVLALVLLVAGATLMTWFRQHPLYLVRNSFLQNPLGPQDKLLAYSEGINEVIVVSERKNPEQKTLFTNGHPMSSTYIWFQRYMRAFVHIPLLQIDNPENVLVICFGVGNTSHAATLHPSVQHLDIVDLSKNVLDQAPYFNDSNKDVLKDPRVHVYVNDGRQFLRSQDSGHYDLITLEPPPLPNAGVSSLYSVEFYELGRRALKSGGFLSQWLPINQISGDNARILIKSFLTIFPNAVLLNLSHYDFILLGQKDGPNQIDWRRVEENIRARPEVAADLERISLRKPVEWLGTFASGSKWMTEKLKDTDTMTDNEPMIEYDHFFITTTLPRELFFTGTFSDWCPSCFNNGTLVPELADLENFLAVSMQILTSDHFSFINPLRIPSFSANVVTAEMQLKYKRFPHLLTESDLHETVNRYPYLKYLTEQ